VAERQKAGVAEQQVEAHGEDREHVDLGHQRARIVADQKREGRQRGHDREAGDPPRHRARAELGRRRRRARGRRAMRDAEQAARPHQQHHRHGEIDEKQRRARQVGCRSPFRPTASRRRWLRAASPA
jgi:hypothetical protein